ncbi:MAG: T9SS type A sorting domain-containing protein [Bacteroidetes bacterium]|nr:T9SS type A sorting domain-containing protein [Bacteroidota bacterium]
MLNGKLLAAANSHEYTAQITGNYQVLVTDSGSCFNLSKITTLVLNKGDGFEMYPNPAADYTELVWSSSSSKSKKIEVFDSTGKLVKSAEVNPKELNYLLSTKTFNQGIYMVRMTIEEELFVKKLMIK